MKIAGPASVVTRRAIAAGLDTALLLPILLLIPLVLTLLDAPKVDSDGTPTLVLATLIGGCLLYWSGGRTPGLLFMGLKVAGERGERVAFRHALARIATLLLGPTAILICVRMVCAILEPSVEVAGTVAAIAAFVTIGIVPLSVWISRGHAGVHDAVSHTRVVRETTDEPVYPIGIDYALRACIAVAALLAASLLAGRFTFKQMIEQWQPFAEHHEAGRLAYGVSKELELDDIDIRNADLYIAPRAHVRIELDRTIDKSSTRYFGDSPTSAPDSIPNPRLPIETLTTFSIPTTMFGWLSSDFQHVVAEHLAKGFLAGAPVELAKKGMLEFRFSTSQRFLWFECQLERRLDGFVTENGAAGPSLTLTEPDDAIWVNPALAIDNRLGVDTLKE